MKRFEDLHCWQEARILVAQIYQKTKLEPMSKDFGLKDQIQRAAISVMANIAEGYHSFSKLESLKFLGYSSRSSSEVCSHLYAALDIGYLTKNEFKELIEQAEKTGRLIRAFIKYKMNK